MGYLHPIQVLIGLLMTNDHNQSHFHDLVRERFSFLEFEGGMSFCGVREVGDADPRETGLVAGYRAADGGIRVDIGWSEVQKSVTVLVHLVNPELHRRVRFLYLDSFVEFISNGRDKSIVAQIYPHMSESEILNTMRKRELLFEQKSLSDVLSQMSERLHKYFADIVDLPADTARNYHAWMALK
jgi:hypothetical protein